MATTLTTRKIAASWYHAPTEDQDASPFPNIGPECRQLIPNQAFIKPRTKQVTLFSSSTRGYGQQAATHLHRRVLGEKTTQILKSYASGVASGRHKPHHGAAGRIWARGDVWMDENGGQFRPAEFSIRRSSQPCVPCPIKNSPLVGKKLHLGPKPSLISEDRWFRNRDRIDQRQMEVYHRQRRPTSSQSFISTDSTRAHEDVGSGSVFYPTASFAGSRQTEPGRRRAVRAPSPMIECRYPRSTTSPLLGTTKLPCATYLDESMRRPGENAKDTYRTNRSGRGHGKGYLGSRPNSQPENDRPSTSTSVIFNRTGSSGKHQRPAQRPESGVRDKRSTPGITVQSPSGVYGGGHTTPVLECTSMANFNDVLPKEEEALLQSAGSSDDRSVSVYSSTPDKCGICYYLDLAEKEERRKSRSITSTTSSDESLANGGELTRDPTGKINDKLKSRSESIYSDESTAAGDGDSGKSDIGGSPLLSSENIFDARGMLKLGIDVGGGSSLPDSSSLDLLKRFYHNSHSADSFKNSLSHTGKTLDELELSDVNINSRRRRCTSVASQRDEEERGKAQKNIVKATKSNINNTANATENQNSGNQLNYEHLPKHSYQNTGHGDAGLNQTKPFKSKVRGSISSSSQANTHNASFTDCVPVVSCWASSPEHLLQDEKKKQVLTGTQSCLEKKTESIGHLEHCDMKVDVAVEGPRRDKHENASICADSRFDYHAKLDTCGVNNMYINTLEDNQCKEKSLALNLVNDFKSEEVYTVGHGVSRASVDKVMNFTEPRPEEQPLSCSSRAEFVRSEHIYVDQKPDNNYVTCKALTDTVLNLKEGRLETELTSSFSSGTETLRMEESYMDQTLKGNTISHNTKRLEHATNKLGKSQGEPTARSSKITAQTKRVESRESVEYKAPHNAACQQNLVKDVIHANETNTDTEKDGIDLAPKDPSKNMGQLTRPENDVTNSSTTNERKKGEPNVDFDEVTEYRWVPVQVEVESMSEGVTILERRQVTRLVPRTTTIKIQAKPTDASRLPATKKVPKTDIIVRNKQNIHKTRERLSVSTGKSLVQWTNVDVNLQAAASIQQTRQQLQQKTQTDWRMTEQAVYESAYNTGALRELGLYADVEISSPVLCKHGELDWQPPLSHVRKLPSCNDRSSPNNSQENTGATLGKAGNPMPSPPTRNLSGSTSIEHSLSCQQTSRAVEKGDCISITARENENYLMQTQEDMAQSLSNIENTKSFKSKSYYNKTLLGKNTVKAEPSKESKPSRTKAAHRISPTWNTEKSSSQQQLSPVAAELQNKLMQPYSKTDKGKEATSNAPTPLEGTDNHVPTHKDNPCSTPLCRDLTSTKTSLCSKDAHFTPRPQKNEEQQQVDACDGLDRSPLFRCSRSFTPDHGIGSGPKFSKTFLTKSVAPSTAQLIAMQSSSSQDLKNEFSRNETPEPILFECHEDPSTHFISTDPLDISPALSSCVPVYHPLTQRVRGVTHLRSCTQESGLLPPLPPLAPCPTPAASRLCTPRELSVQQCSVQPMNFRNGNSHGQARVTLDSRYQVGVGALKMHYIPQLEGKEDVPMKLDLDTSITTQTSHQLVCPTVSPCQGEVESIYSSTSHDTLVDMSKDISWQHHEPGIGQSEEDELVDELNGLYAEAKCFDTPALDQEKTLDVEMFSTCQVPRVPARGLVDSGKAEIVWNLTKKDAGDELADYEKEEETGLNEGYAKDIVANNLADHGKNENYQALCDFGKQEKLQNVDGYKEMKLCRFNHSEEQEDIKKEEGILNGEQVPAGDNCFKAEGADKSDNVLENKKTLPPDQPVKYNNNQIEENETKDDDTQTGEGSRRDDSDQANDCHQNNDTVLKHENTGTDNLAHEEKYHRKVTYDRRHVYLSNCERDTKQKYLGNDKDEKRQDDPIGGNKELEQMFMKDDENRSPKTSGKYERDQGPSKRMKYGKSRNHENHRYECHDRSESNPIYDKKEHIHVSGKDNDKQNPDISDTYSKDRRQAYQRKYERDRSRESNKNGRDDQKQEGGSRDVYSSRRRNFKDNDPVQRQEELIRHESLRRQRTARKSGNERVDDRRQRENAGRQKKTKERDIEKEKSQNHEKDNKDHRRDDNDTSDLAKRHKDRRNDDADQKQERTKKDKRGRKRSERRKNDHGPKQENPTINDHYKAEGDLDKVQRTSDNRAQAPSPKSSPGKTRCERRRSTTRCDVMQAAVLDLALTALDDKGQEEVSPGVSAMTGVQAGQVGPVKDWTFKHGLGTLCPVQKVAQPQSWSAASDAQHCEPWWTESQKPRPKVTQHKGHSEFLRLLCQDLPDLNRRVDFRAHGDP